MIKKACSSLIIIAVFLGSFYFSEAAPFCPRLEGVKTKCFKPPPTPAPEPTPRPSPGPVDCLLSCYQHCWDGKTATFDHAVTGHSTCSHYTETCTGGGEGKPPICVKTCDSYIPGTCSVQNVTCAVNSATMISGTCKGSICTLPDCPAGAIQGGDRYTLCGPAQKCP